MDDQRKTKAELIGELDDLRRQVAALERERQAARAEVERALAQRRQAEAEQLESQRAAAERRRLERELADAEALLEAAFEQTPVPMALVDAPDAVLRILNPACRELLGIEDEPSHVGMPLSDIRPTWQDFDSEGNPVPVAEHPVALALKEIIVNNREYRVRRKDGRERWALMSSTPVYNTAGELIAGFAAFPDITERKRAEEAAQLNAAELERSNRDLEDFAASASHDLQEPLRKVQAFGERLQVKYGQVLDETGRDYLERMSSAAVRMQAMLEGLLAYSRVATRGQPFVPVDLAELAAEAVADLELRLEQTGGRVDVGPLPRLEADPLQMRLLLQNLIGNALKFHRPGVPPAVQVWGRVKAPGWIEVGVADNGIGFDDKYLSRLFHPFQRLHGHSEFEGSGMGLAICRKIAERHGGAITAESVPAEGSTFKVVLPVRQAAEKELP